MRIRARHLTTAQVHAEVNACHGRREVSDACAVTIASWYASPGAVGSVLASLSTGAEFDPDALNHDVSATIAEVWAEDSTNNQDRRNLSMLGTWAIRLRDRL